MGQRSRKQGISNALLRSARAAARERDAEASDIAQAVYNIARELKLAHDADPLPLPILAPLMAAAERSAPGAAKMAGLNHHDQALVLDVAAYLVAGFREMVVCLTPEHFASWREATDRGDTVVASSRYQPPEEGENGNDDATGAGPGEDAGAEPSATARRAEDREQDQDRTQAPEGRAEGGDEDPG